MYKAVIFDLDGTLVDSIEDLADAMNASLIQHGHPVRTLAECRSFVGDGARRFVERAVPSACDEPALADRILEGFKTHYTQCWADKTLPYDGIPELLDALVARGLKLAVLSNKLEQFTAQMVTSLFPRWRFTSVRGERPGVARKPDPAGALAIATELGATPRECIYLGDTATDMRTAVGAGMVAVGVLWGFRDAAELIDGGAAHLIEHPRELIALMERGFRPISRA